jgi:hypothetical protein
MRNLASLVVFVALGLFGFATADDTVGEDRIKVFLFGAVAFGLEVGVDLQNDTCHSLDNNLLVFHSCPRKALTWVQYRWDGPVDSCWWA